MNDSEVLAFVEHWAPMYWHVKPVRMSIVERPGGLSNYYEVSGSPWRYGDSTA